MKTLITIISSAAVFMWVVSQPYAEPPTVTASYYGKAYRGKMCADNKTVFDERKLTAAHKTLPFGTKVKVRLAGSKTRSCIVTITDRGPFVKGREIDLSKAAFSKLAQVEAGLIRVKLDVIEYGK